MEKYPKGTWPGKIRALVRAVGELQIPIHAANAGFFMVLSVFPMLLLLLSLLRRTALTTESLLGLLENILPGALMSGAERLVINTWHSATGTVVGISAVTALWSASRGIQGLRTGLNGVYGVSESRGYLRTRLISVAYTFLFLAVMVLTLALHVFGRGLLRFLETVDVPVVTFLLEVVGLRFLLLLGIQSLIFTLMYMALPNRHNRFWSSLPGGVLASLGWLVFSHLFSVYVEHFNRYSHTFGSIYGVALGMLWLYCCLSILFFGGGLNRWLESGRKRQN